MLVRKPRYAKEEAARLGDEIYNRDVKPVVEPDNIGKWAAVDLDTATWELGGDEISASDKMFARNPDAQIWMVHVGYRYTRRFGGGRVR